jgi:hypothetical protein
MLLCNRQNLPAYLRVTGRLGPGAQARGFPPIAVGAVLSRFHARRNARPGGVVHRPRLNRPEGAGLFRAIP